VNPQSWNRYTYVLGDPINGNDPAGRGEDDVDLCEEVGLISSPDGTGCYEPFDPPPDPPSETLPSCFDFLSQWFPWFLDTGSDLRLIAMRILNENSFWDRGHNSYQTGAPGSVPPGTQDEVGAPSGPVITWASLQLEDNTLAGVLLNLAQGKNYGYNGGSLQNAANQNGRGFGHANTIVKAAQNESVLGDDCVDIAQAASAAFNMFGSAVPPYYNNWRAALQPGPPTFVRKSGPCDFQINNTIFINYQGESCGQ